MRAVRENGKNNVQSAWDAWKITFLLIFRPSKQTSLEWGRGWLTCNLATLFSVGTCRMTNFFQMVLILWRACFQLDYTFLALQNNPSQVWHTLWSRLGIFSHTFSRLWCDILAGESPRPEGVNGQHRRVSGREALLQIVLHQLPQQEHGSHRSLHQHYFVCRSESCCRSFL